MSFNRWMYGYGNPVKYTDPTGHSPLGQNPYNGQPNYEICYARWIVSTGGELTTGIIESIYHQYPDETLQPIQQQFNIQLPPGYYFRYTTTGSPAFKGNEDAKGVNWWMTEYLPLVGKIFEISENGCFLLDSTIPDQATHIDYTIYITNRAFVDFEDYYPDDIATIMIHD